MGVRGDNLQRVVQGSPRRDQHVQQGLAALLLDENDQAPSLELHRLLDHVLVVGSAMPHASLVAVQHLARDVGRCMNALKERYPGKMDMGKASTVVKGLLR